MSTSKKMVAEDIRFIVPRNLDRCDKHGDKDGDNSLKNVNNVHNTCCRWLTYDQNNGLTQRVY